jgi:hypothetical protein
MKRIVERRNVIRFLSVRMKLGCLIAVDEYREGGFLCFIQLPCPSSSDSNWNLVNSGRTD